MIWRITWTARAAKDRDRLDSQMRVRVLEALERLATTGQGDVKRLRGHEEEWRLRVGDWRVRLEFDHDTQTIRVLRVLPRGSAYRD